jgi:hypothetical protein
MLNQAVPIYKKDQISFSREEKEGYMSIAMENAASSLKIFNETTRVILDLCDGSNSIAQIHGTMRQRYPEERSNRLLKDLTQTLMIMSNENIIDWKDDKNPFIPSQSLFEVQYDSDSRVRRATESDFSVITEMAKCAMTQESTASSATTKVIIVHPMAMIGIYNDISLRARLFNFAERIYFIEHNGLATGMLCILDDFPMSCRGIATLLTLSGENCDLDDVSKLFNTAFTDVKKYMEKIKCSLFTDQKEVKTYDSLLQDIGFVREGILQSEYDPGVDEWLYGKVL